MAKRRAKGEGTVYRRGDGRVVGEYVDANGNRRYLSGKTKAEVRRRLRGLLADRDEGIAYDSENLTVGAYLARWLLATKGTVRQRTWERHEQVVRLHLGPTLGGVRLDRLGALQVQALYGRKLEEGLSPRTVEIVHATLHKALKQAVRWALVPRNAAEGATPPRPVGKEVTPLSRDQARALLDAARGDALEAFWVLAVTTGMRNGELLGLQWRDIDLDARTLRVRRSVFNGAISPPKTAAGNRTIRLSAMAADALERHRKAAPEEGTWEWVFPPVAQWDSALHPQRPQPLLEAPTAEGGASGLDPDARPPAHLRDAAARSGRAGQGGQRDARPRQRCDHARRLPAGAA